MVSASVGILYCNSFSYNNFRILSVLSLRSMPHCRAEEQSGHMSQISMAQVKWIIVQ